MATDKLPSWGRTPHYSLYLLDLSQLTDIFCKGETTHLAGNSYEQPLARQREPLPQIGKDRIEGVCLLHLGEISDDSRFIAILKIHDENGRRNRIELFIGEHCGKARSVGRPSSLILSATFGFSNIDGLDPLGALL